MAMAYKQAEKYVEGLPAYVKAVELKKGQIRQSDFVINAFHQGISRSTDSIKREEPCMYGMENIPKAITFDKGTCNKILDLANNKNLELISAGKAFKMVFKSKEKDGLKRKIRRTVAYLEEDKFFAASPILLQEIGTWIYNLNAGSA